VVGGHSSIFLVKGGAHWPFPWLCNLSMCPCATSQSNVVSSYYKDPGQDEELIINNQLKMDEHELELDE